MYKTQILCQKLMLPPCSLWAIITPAVLLSEARNTITAVIEFSPD